jgi:hypothetical protein
MAARLTATPDRARPVAIHRFGASTVDENVDATIKQRFAYRTALQSLRASVR